MRTIPTMVGAFLIVTALLPLLVVVAVPVDMVRSLLTGKPWMTLRMVAMAWVYLASEVAVIVVSGAQWLVLGGPFGGGPAPHGLGVSPAASSSGG